MHCLHTLVIAPHAGVRLCAASFQLSRIIPDDFAATVCLALALPFSRYTVPTSRFRSAVRMGREAKTVTGMRRGIGLRSPAYGHRRSLCISGSNVVKVRKAGPEIGGAPAHNTALQEGESEDSHPGTPRQFRRGHSIDLHLYVANAMPLSLG
jgi:hypothetical protein